MRQHNGGFMTQNPFFDTHNRARCPNCGRFITFDEYIDEKGMKWHSWSCEFCWAFNEHGHSQYGQSSFRYDDPSKVCYGGRE